MDLVRPDDSRYDETRSVSNGMLDNRPAVIAQCASAADVIQALQLAQAGHLDIAGRRQSPGGRHVFERRRARHRGTLAEAFR